MELTKEEEEVIRKMREEKKNDREKIVTIFEATTKKLSSAETDEKFKEILYAFFELLDSQISDWAKLKCKESINQFTTKVKDSTTDARKKLNETMEKIFDAFDSIKL